MIIPALTVAKLIWSFTPIIRDIIAAKKRHSDGGPVITPAEWDKILRRHGDDVRKDVNRRARRALKRR